MNLQGIMLSEIRQMERQTLYNLTYMWNKKITMIKQAHKENRWVIARAWGWEWVRWLKRVERHKPPDIKQVSHGCVICSMATIHNTVLYI